MTDELIIQEAVRLVQDGVSVTFPVKGRSMLPFIFGGRESVILQKPSSLQRGQVVLAQVGPDRYVVHRIIKIEPDRITLMGDRQTYLPLPRMWLMKRESAGLWNPKVRCLKPEYGT